MPTTNSPGQRWSADRGKTTEGEGNIAPERDSGQRSLALAALKYVGHGWAVLPCQPRGKAPMVANGFHRASTDRAQVAEWWRRWPNANIGAVPGRCELRGGGTLLVLDLDGPIGRQSAAELGIPSDTAAVTTGRPEGGEHRYFHAPAGLAIGNRSPAPGLDVRHTGGYVLVPPSVHPSGAVYRWRGASAWEPGAVLPLPEHILELLTAPRLEPVSTGKRWGPTFNAGEAADALTWRRAAAYVARVPSGLADDRKQTAYRLSAALVHDIGLPERDAFDLLDAWNGDNRPPLSESALARIFANAGRYGRHRGAA